MRVIAGSVRSSHQTACCFRRLEKLVLPSIFDTGLPFLMTWNLQSYPATALSEIMWHFGGQNILWLIHTYFQGSRPQTAGSRLTTPPSANIHTHTHTHIVTKWSLYSRRRTASSMCSADNNNNNNNNNKLCAWRHDMPPPLSSTWGTVAPRAAEPTAAPADGNVAAVSHVQYVPTLTAAAACA